MENNYQPKSLKDRMSNAIEALKERLKDPHRDTSEPAYRAQELAERLNRDMARTAQETRFVRYVG